MPQFSPQAANYWGLINEAAQRGFGAADTVQAVAYAVSATGAPPLSFSDYSQISQMFGLAVAQRNAASNFETALGQVATLASSGASNTTVGLDAGMISQQVNSRPLDQQAAAPNYVIRFGVTENPGTPQETQSFRQIALGNYLPLTVNEVADLLNSVLPDIQTIHGTSLALSGPVNIFSM